MNLAEKFLPRYDFSEKHCITINASKKDCYIGTYNFDLSSSPLICLLFRLRKLPAKAQPLFAFAKGMKFTLLEEKRCDEFIFGFWVKKEIEWIIDKNIFVNNNTSHTLKVIWHFEFEAIKPEITKVTTVTKIMSRDRSSKIIFGLYWALIRHFSGLIRRVMLLRLKRMLESTSCTKILLINN